MLRVNWNAPGVSLEKSNNIVINVVTQQEIKGFNNNTISNNNKDNILLPSRPTTQSSVGPLLLLPLHMIMYKNGYVIHTAAAARIKRSPAEATVKIAEIRIGTLRASPPTLRVQSD